MGRTSLRAWKLVIGIAVKVASSRIRERGDISDGQNAPSLLHKDW